MVKPTREEIIKEYLSERGRKLGQMKTERKRIAVRKNLEKALSKRWGKKIKLRKIES